MKKTLPKKKKASKFPIIDVYLNGPYDLSLKIDGKDIGRYASNGSFGFIFDGEYFHAYIRSESSPITIEKKSRRNTKTKGQCLSLRD